ncbi:uncharacterized protein VTP21DRAFT_6250 [Calcarisporiella thermophila]|uniref:uncharacterized protein n=1 Tax=Calcarisporiella thermophila TaxID=911321 RepID=UPI003743CB58
MDTFVPVSGFDSSRLKNTILILPVVSIGNVPQLTVDLILTTLELERVGFLDDPNVVSLAGPNENGRGITVAVEVFVTKDGKYTVIQQRTPPHKNHSTRFSSNLVAFIKTHGFADVLILSSADATLRRDMQLAGQPFRVLSTPNISSGLQKRIEQLGLVKLEPSFGQDEPTPSQPEELPADGVPKIAGGGYSRTLFQKATEQGVEAAMLVMFAMEGDNIPHSKAMVECVDRLLGLSAEGVREWRAPKSWRWMFGAPAARELYD